MKVPLPSRIKIGAVEASIICQEHLQTDEACYGVFNRRTGKIAIDAGLKGSKRDRSFGHELMEVIKESYALDLSEDVMSNIANGWLEFLWQLGIEFDWREIKNA